MHSLQSFIRLIVITSCLFAAGVSCTQAKEEKKSPATSPSDMNAMMNPMMMGQMSGMMNPHMYMNMMNPMMGMGRQPPPPKGNIRELWELLGVDMIGDEVVWQDYNPNPKLRFLEK